MDWYPLSQNDMIMSSWDDTWDDRRLAVTDPQNQLVNILSQRFERLTTNRAFVAIVFVWINLFGINNIMRLFVNHSLVICLTGHGFAESVTPQFEIIGQDNFVYLMTNS